MTMTEIALIVALVIAVCTLSVDRRSSHLCVEILGFIIVKAKPGTGMCKNLNMIRGTEGKRLFVVTPWGRAWKKFKRKNG